MKRKEFDNAVRNIIIGDRIKIEYIVKYSFNRLAIHRSEGFLREITEDRVIHLEKGFYQSYRTIKKIDMC